MCCVARMFGGLRTSDLHALTWQDFYRDAQGNFVEGWAPRTKTDDPQKLEIPIPLRPILMQWWLLQRKPEAGPVFPVRRPSTRKGAANRTGQHRIRGTS